MKMARLLDGTNSTLSVEIWSTEEIFFSIVSHLMRRTPTFSSSHALAFGIRLLWKHAFYCHITKHRHIILSYKIIKTQETKTQIQIYSEQSA